MTFNLNDEKLQALRGYLGVADGHITQLEKDYLVDLGATGDSINDLWMDYLVNISAFPQARGQLNAMQYEWLGDLGFDGNLNERWVQYWLAVQDDDIFIMTEDGFLILTESGEAMEIES